MIGVPQYHFFKIKRERFPGLPMASRTAASAGRWDVNT